MQPITDTLLELLKIDSLTGREKSISDFIRTQYAAFRNCVYSTSGHTTVFSFDVDPAFKRIGFYGHLDTVTNQQEFPPTIKDGLAYGCGASDMKGGVAVMMTLMNMLLDGEKPNHNLYFVFYDREEGPTNENGLFTFVPEHIDRLACDLALVMEPTDNTIQKGCVGSLHAEVTFVGKSGHSARPWEGINAVQKSWKLLKKLDETPPEKVTVDTLDFYNVYTVTHANGGQTRNSVPAAFTLDINYRFAPNRSNDRAVEDVLAFIGHDARVSIRDIAPSGAVVSDNDSLDSLSRRFSLKTLPKQAWTDIARLNEHGIPAVNFGPGSPAMAHKKNEYIRIASLEESKDILINFLFDPGPA